MDGLNERSSHAGASGRRGARPSLSLLDLAPSIGALVVLALAIATVFVAARNRSLQETVATGQARLATAQTAANLDNSLIRLLTAAAVEHDDAGIKALLAANGITYRQSTPAATPPSTTPGTAK